MSKAATIWLYQLSGAETYVDVRCSVPVTLGAWPTYSWESCADAAIFYEKLNTCFAMFYLFGLVIFVWRIYFWLNMFSAFSLYQTSRNKIWLPSASLGFFRKGHWRAMECCFCCFVGGAVGLGCGAPFVVVGRGSGHGDVVDGGGWCEGGGGGRCGAGRDGAHSVLKWINRYLDDLRCT